MTMRELALKTLQGELTVDSLAAAFQRIADEATERERERCINIAINCDGRMRGLNIAAAIRQPPQPKE